MQNKIYNASEYAIRTIKDLKNNKELYENMNFDGKDVYKLILQIHETYLKILKGE